MAIKRFLVVDHNAEITLQVKALLGELRMQDVTTSSDCEEALTLLGPKRIEFVIVNWELKPMSGLIFVQRVRAQAASAHLPFLIYSERLKGDEVKLLEEIGISNVVPFPLDKNKVTEAIKAILGRENALDPVIKELRTVSSMVGAGQYKEAMDRLMPCTTSEAMKDTSYTLKGDIETRQQNFKEAEKSLDIALKKNPNNRGTQQILAKVMSQTGRHNEAIELLQKLCESSPLNVSNMLSLGGAFVTADRHEEADKILKKVNDIDPSNPQAQDMKGTIAFKEGNFDLARELLKSTPNGDEMCRSLNNIAVGLVAKGQFDRAITSYRSAIEIMQDKGLAHVLKYNLGVAFKKANKLQEAMTALGESLIENPTFEKSQKSFKHVLQLMKAQNVAIDQAFVDKVNAAATPKAAA